MDNPVSSGTIVDLCVPVGIYVFHSENSAQCEMMVICGLDGGKGKKS